MLGLQYVSSPNIPIRTSLLEDPFREELPGMLAQLFRPRSVQHCQNLQGEQFFGCALLCRGSGSLNRRHYVIRTGLIGIFSIVRLKLGGRFSKGGI